MAEKRDDLDRIADAVAERTPIDWAAVKRAHPGLAPELAGLRLLDRIAEVHRSALPDTEPSVLFAWGPLQVLEQIGAGSFGSVWRAYDPDLRREVALKLLREDLGDLGENEPGTERFLEEARRMARVRHPNVLVIHGAARHGRRAGFWAELVRGRTLEELLRANGPLGAGEAALIGVEVCRAVSAVHAAGLIHGDVKTSNVMRDDHGRILLMDFGAGSERTGAGLPAARGTPVTLAPELFSGSAPGPSSDLYALGVMLYRLVSVRYPVSGDSVEQIERRHQRGERVSLRDVRPDLPAAFVAIVERATAPDPAARFGSAGEMETALAGLLGPAQPQGGARRLRRRAARWPLAAALGLLAVAAAVAATQWLRGRPDTTPLETPTAAGPTTLTAPVGPPAAASPAVVSADASLPVVSAEATLCRSRGGAKEPLVPGTLVRPGDALFLELRLSAAAHVYVLNEDAGGRIVQLFPIAGVDLCNPLGPGDWHRLPGSRGGTVFDWQMAGGPGREGFLVIAARGPLLDLGERIARLPRAQPPATSSSVARETARGISGVVPVDAATEGEATAGLSELARAISTEADGPGTLWIRQFVVFNAGR